MGGVGEGRRKQQKLVFLQQALDTKVSLVTCDTQVSLVTCDTQVSLVPVTCDTKV